MPKGKSRRFRIRLFTNPKQDVRYMKKGERKLFYGTRHFAKKSSYSPRRSPELMARDRIAAIRARKANVKRLRSLR